MLVARAAEARDVLPDALRERGGEVDVVALYETVREAPDDAAIAAAGDADYVTFTSSSTVTNLTRGARRPLPGGGADRLDRPDHQRRPCARRASRSRSRPSATTSTACSPPCSPTPPRVELRHAAPALPADRVDEHRRAGACRGRGAARDRRHRRRADRGAGTAGPDLDRAAGLGAPLLRRRAADRGAPRGAAARRRARGLRDRRGAAAGHRVPGQVAERHPPRGPQAGRDPDRGPSPGRLGGGRRRPEPDDRRRRVPGGPARPRHLPLRLRRRLSSWPHTAP